MTEVYLGNLPHDLRDDEVERFFKDYGKINAIHVKKGFAFITFNDPRDAKDAVRDLDGSKFCGSPVTVDISRGKPDRNGTDRDDRGDFGRRSGGDFGRDRNGRDDKYGYEKRDRGDFGRDRGDFGRDRGDFGRDRRDFGRDRRDDFGRGRRDDFGRGRGGFGGGRRDRSPRRNGGFGGGGRRSTTEKTQFGIIIKNLSTRVEWYNLKDECRKYGDVTYAQANKEREKEGVVTFRSKDEMINAMHKMNGSEFYGYRMECEYEFPDMDPGYSGGNESRRDERDSRENSTDRFEDRRQRSRSRSPSRDRFRDRSRSPINRSRSRSR